MIKEEISSSKKLKNQCPVYEIKRYTLPNYWYLFKGKRPKGFKARNIHIKKVRKRVEDNKDLTTQIKRLKLSKLKE